MALMVDSWWKVIMEDNLFTEVAEISSPDFSFSVHGIFYSGTYGEESPAPYAPKRFESKESFQIALNSLPDTIEKPEQSLKGAILVLPTRGKYRVSDISGKQSGMLTLELQQRY